jgi:DNA-binding response OmpR family regulator
MIFSDNTANSNNNNNVNSKRILVVDDEPDVVSVFKMMLEMNGYEVDAYQDPSLALSNFKPNSYGLLILDIRMPTMNGFELYKNMRNIDNKVEVCWPTLFIVENKDTTTTNVNSINVYFFVNHLSHPLIILHITGKI